MSKVWRSATVGLVVSVLVTVGWFGMRGGNGRGHEVSSHQKTAPPADATRRTTGPLNGMSRLGARHLPATRGASTVDSDTADSTSQLSETQLAQIQPMLDSIAAIEEVATNEGDLQLAEQADKERQRLVAAAAGLQNQKAVNR